MNEITTTAPSMKQAADDIWVYNDPPISAVGSFRSG
jgi:hypothetical protein